MMASKHIIVDSNSYEKLKIFKHLGSLLSKILFTRKYNVELKQEIRVILYKHFCLLDFSPRIKKLKKYKKIVLSDYEYVIVKHGISH